MRTSLFITTALLAGFVLALVAAWPEGIEEASFRLGLEDTAAGRKLVEEAVRTYNGISARFYATAGELEGLEDIPASPLMKRRLFKDISMLRGDGLVMVFDLDRMSFDSVNLNNPIEAEAITDEVWAVALQDVDTRAPVFNVKAVEVQARYVLYKVPFAGGPERWVIYDVDVYPKGAEIPLLKQGPVI